MMSRFLVRFIVAVVVVLVSVWWLGRERGGQCQFMSVDETVRFIVGDADGYHRRFHKEDLYARKVASVDEYCQRIVKSGCIGTFTPEEQQRIVVACRDADRFFRERCGEAWFDGYKCSRMTWKIACVDGMEYENGLPHTRGSIIFFPRRYLYIKNQAQYTRTLIHEKIHVYQKSYPDHTKLYVAAHGFEVVGHRRGSLVRANSDTDDFVYRVYGTGEQLFAKYKNHTPESIEDIFYADNSTQRNEHPFERMAVDIAGRYNG